MQLSVTRQKQQLTVRNHSGRKTMVFLLLFSTIVYPIIDYTGPITTPKLSALYGKTTECTTLPSQKEKKDVR